MCWKFTMCFDFPLLHNKSPENVVVWDNTTVQARGDSTSLCLCSLLTGASVGWLEWLESGWLAAGWVSGNLFWKLPGFLGSSPSCIFWTWSVSHSHDRCLDLKSWDCPAIFLSLLFMWLASASSQHGGRRVVGSLTWQLASPRMSFLRGETEAGKFLMT